MIKKYVLADTKGDNVTYYNRVNKNFSNNLEEASVFTKDFAEGLLLALSGKDNNLSIKKVTYTLKIVE